MGLTQPETKEHSKLMDRNYRFQRHVYDVTRKFVLLGRDRLLRQMDVRPGDRVLEVGCGTARNLLKLARLRDCELYGIDASRLMLKVAKKKIVAAGLASRIRLKVALAEDLSAATFALDRPFDSILFSYSLSMIVGWEQAIEAALANVKPGGAVYIVDFWDQRDLPAWFRWAFQRFLAGRHAEHHPELLEYLQSLSREGRGEFAIEELSGRYSYLVTFTSGQSAASPSPF